MDLMKEAIAAKVASVWGVNAPYPIANVRELLRKQRQGRLRKSFQVPTPYLSWEHVAAFDSSILTIEERDRILERKAKCARPGYRYRA
jgi:hypothetical protein